jgi:hypothetical protein
LARLPAQLASSYVGAHIQEKDYRSVIIVSAVACVLFVAGYIYKDKIMAGMHRASKKEEPAVESPEKKNPAVEAPEMKNLADEKPEELI